MRRALVRHDELLRKAVEREAGVIFKTVGDSFFCAFEKPENAVRAAIEAQFALANEPWPPSIGEILVRIGLHTGAAVIRRGDYFGPTLNRVARLTMAAHGGQILVSAATAALVAKKLGGAKLRDLGTHRLKDLGEPEVIFQVVASGIRSDFLAPNSLDATPNNLPSQISSFVGRRSDLDQLRALTGRHPLVTVAGLGGIGKTRLAVQLAAEVIADFKDGCWFVALRDVDDASQIAQTMADALRLRSAPGDPVEAQLLEYLFRKRMLVVFDSAEHLVDGVAAFIRRLLGAVSDIRVIVTSREPLHITGEHVLRISGIDEPERLFLDRARALRSDLAMSEETSRAISNICTKLQGIPLAIELTAARVAMLSVVQLDELLMSEIAARSSSKKPLAEGALHAMLEWSHRLLSDDEKRFFARLAIYDGSFSLESARAIAIDDVSGGDAVELLGSLADKSLVSHAIDGAVSRFHLLNVVREFASERLRVSGDLEAVSNRYCAYYISMVRSLAASGTNPEAVNVKLALDWLNVRSALRLALEERLDIEGGRWAIRSLWDFWLATGRTTEGWYWINRGLEGTDLPARLRIELLQRAAQIAASRGDYAALDPLAKLLVEAHERSGDASALGNALQLLMHAKTGLGNGAEAELYQRRALEQFQLAGDRRGIALALANLGTIAEQQHLNYDTARQLMLHSLALFRELGVPQNCAMLLGNLSVICMRAGEFVQALAYAKESLEIYSRLGNELDAGMQHVNVAEIYVESRNPAEALPALRAARRSFGESPNRLYLAYYFEAAFKAAVELKAYEQAALIYGYAERHRTVARTPLQPSERETIESRRAILARKLNAPVLDRLTREGASMETATAEGLIARLESAPLRPSGRN
jgi:predicted ATPase